MTERGAGAAKPAPAIGPDAAKPAIGPDAAKPAIGPDAAKPAGQRRGGTLQRGALIGGVVAVVLAMVAGVAFGAATLAPGSVAVELLNLLPGVHLRSGFNEREIAIITELRLPRVVLAMLVGAMLGLSGAAYQGVFRNALADPYLLGVAAGAGLAVTALVTFRTSDSGLTGLPAGTPLAAFVGAAGAVVLTYLLGGAGTRDRSPATLILAGVAVSAFLSAVQTYLLQRNIGNIREVYTWLLGRLAIAGWHDVLLLLPYAVVCAAVILLHRRELDVLAVGDEEAANLGLHPQRSRYILLAAASLGTAAAVSVSGLIGFVGVIVPHTVRLLAGYSYRAILPLSMLYGAAFLVIADLVGRTIDAPAEVPIGVITAFFGAPFFALVLRSTSRMSS